MSGRFPSTPGDISLATFMLRVEQDLVSLRRRARAAGEDCGLDERGLRALSAAAYDLAALFYRSGSGTAHARLHLGDGPALLLTVQLRGSAAEVDRLRHATHESANRLRGLVDRLTIDDSAETLSVTLGVNCPGARAPRVPHAADPGEAVAPVDPEDLNRAVGDLHAELEETNRGVVALHAELEGQAERLRQAEDRLRVLLDSVQDYGICMLDSEGRVESWNAGAERLFGYTADEITGRSFAAFYPPAERDEGTPDLHLAAALETGRLECEGPRVRRGGSVFDAHVVFATVRGAGQALRGFSMVVRDVTERRRLEDDLRRRAEELAAANRAKEEFLATLSHELRTPLNAMLGWTRLLRMGKLDEAARARALETIERNAHVQEQLIADILDVSRIVTGKLRLELRPVDLEPIVDASVDAVRPTAEAKQITLSCSVSAVGSVLGDPDRLQQVLWNLLSNAIKFTPAGGSVHLDVQRQGVSAVISVADSGEGIPSELLPYVFDRFTQGDGSVTRMHGGLGLGLSIVRHIVELHGGEVRASSEGVGRGSRFSVLLPIRAAREVGQAPGATPPRPLTGVKVLVVDDEPSARELLARSLAESGAATAAAGSAEEAMGVLTAFRPDVLVSDIVMPGEDGYALIRRIRALRERIAEVPAIAMTGHDGEHDRRRAIMAGYQHFIPKPVEADELAAVVRTLAPFADR